VARRSLVKLEPNDRTISRRTQAALGRDSGRHPIDHHARINDRIELARTLAAIRQDKVTRRLGRPRNASGSVSGSAPFPQRERPTLLAASQCLHITAQHDEPPYRASALEAFRTRPSGVRSPWIVP